MESARRKPPNERENEAFRAEASVLPRAETDETTNGVNGAVTGLTTGANGAVTVLTTGANGAVTA